MYSLLVLAFAVGLTSADVGLGYHYKPPTSFGSYRVPPQQASANNGQYNIGYYNSLNGFNYKYTDHNAYPGQTIGFQNTANNAYQVNGVNQGFKPAVIKGDLGTNYDFQNTLNKYQAAYNRGNNYKEAASFQSQNSVNYANVNGINREQAFQSGYEVSSQTPQVFKHFYIHAAPEDEDSPKLRTPLVLPPPQKHYKIIFIKAPTQLSSTQFVPVPQQNEEKTIVYVLVNKPEEGQNIVTPKIEQKPPAKPEVYFIKYNNKEGSQAVIENIVRDYNKGQSVSFTNVNTGAASSSPQLQGSLGVTGAQIVNTDSIGSSGAQIGGNTEFGTLSTQSGFVSNPLLHSASGHSDGTLSSISVDKTLTSTSSDTGFNSGSNLGLNGASDSAGFNGVSSSAGFNGASTSSGFNSVSTSSGFNGATSGISNGESAGSSAFGNGYNSGFNNNEYNIASTTSGTISTGAVNSLTDSQYNGSTISTSQGVPHETYGIPKFSV
ncbi:uncharacterized protein DDB_G0283357 [Amyelois transitella]|uniref:uncharacterized protein DDB_G0283357 n=1 Tax=Amyelois transitella TaxID=680683 RepID=UPI00067D46AA|nr:uncharacterized protein DDB_G0283357 [Amyelois transitella]